MLWVSPTCSPTFTGGSTRPAQQSSRISRAILVTDRHLAGADRDAEFVVAWLIATHPRTKEAERAMAALIHDRMSEAIAATAPPYWWQCCVLIEAIDGEDYFKTDSHA
jgi:hypothetical protein